jgi:hypothetical protein
MTTIVKFPYNASRRSYSRRPRKSINGMPEERAAKAAAAKSTAATVVNFPTRENPARKPGRRANPLRAKFAPISPAVTTFGKMQVCAESLSELCPGVRRLWLEKLCCGAESARIVANELDQAAARLGKIRLAQKLLDLFEGANRRPASTREELEQWVASPEGRAAVADDRGKDGKIIP